MSIIHIRPVTIADARSIWALVCLLEEQEFDFAVAEKILAQNLQHPHYIYLLAENENGLACGYISCHGQLLLHHMNMVYEIQELVVMPQARGLGIGKKLVNVLQEILNTRDCDSFEVTSSNRRKDAHRFYDACGFCASHVKFTKRVNQ